MNIRAIVWTLALCLIAASGVWLVLSNARSTDLQRLAQLEIENRELRAKVEKLQQAVNLPGPGLEEPRAGRTGQGPDVRGDAKRTPFDENQIIVSLRERLVAEENAAVGNKSRISELERETESLHGQLKGIAAERSELTEQITSVKAQLDQVQAEIKIRNEQVAQAQNESRRLREGISEAGRKLAPVQKAAADLLDLNRRRETYLTTLLNRYRDLNQQYRTFISVVENRNGTEATGAAPSGPEVARIQNTLALAEEDMRQLNQLTVQAQRLQKQLEGK